MPCAAAAAALSGRLVSDDAGVRNSSDPCPLICSARTCKHIRTSGKCPGADIYRFFDALRAGKIR